jgi:hypothetical protein
MGEKMYRETYCARTGPLPLLPSGPGGFGGIAPRRTRHIINDNTAWAEAGLHESRIATRFRSTTQLK